MLNRDRGWFLWRAVAFLPLLLIVVLIAAQCPAATEPPPAVEPPVAEEPITEPVEEPTEEPVAVDEPTEEPVAPEPAPEALDPFAEGCWDFPEEPITIEIWWHEYGPFTAYVYELIDRYQALHPNVTIEAVVGGTADIFQKQTVGLATGTGPDILDQDISYYPAYYDMGVLEPINLEVFCADSQADIEAQFLGDVISGTIFDGTIYALPYQANSMSFFMSKDAFEEVGLDVEKDAPKTWDDLKRVGAMLKKVENGVTVRKGYDFPYQSRRWQLQAFQPMVEQFGGTLLNEDQTACLLNSEPAVNAMTLWKEVTEITGDPAVSLATPSHPNQDFIDGRTAIWMTGPWATSQLLESQIGDRWAVTSLPQLDPNNPRTMVYGFAWAVNKDKPEINKLVAWDFIRFMLMQPEEWLQKAAFIQPRVGLLDTEIAQNFPFIDVHLRDVETATWYLQSVHTTEIVEIVGRAIERVIFEGVDPQTSLDQAQDECTKVLAGQ